jgi:OmcA/MtrC family decaheme c-type cytochrome
MALLHCGMTLLAASNLLVPSHVGDVPARRLHTVRTPQMYATSQAEHYLTAKQLAYIRPGFHVTVKSVTIGADRKPVVQLAFTDDLGQPLDRLGVETPGTLSLSFLIAWYDPVNIDYVNYITRPQTSPITGVTANQASTDSGGTWTDTALGQATYTFGKALPSGYDATKTHTLGIYGNRTIDLTDPIEISKRYPVNVTYDFRPDGQSVTDRWDATTFATCNQCHDPLAAHGETGREDPRVCVLCHNDTQSLDPDTGNTVNFKVMIHKIHMGESLPSVEAGHPYQIIGYMQGVNDFSDVVFPQDVRNCTTCHKSPDPAGKTVAQAHIWYTQPNRAACGSCHDNIDWVTGDGHIAGPQLDDSACGDCHIPQGESEFDVSIMGAHTIPTKSAQLKGLNMQILNVSGAAPGAPVTVLFKVTNADGSPVSPSSLDRFSIFVNGPTTDYAMANPISETATSATASGDAWLYTFKTPLPADATGSWTASADAYRNVTIDNHTDTGLSVRECAFNPTYTFAVTDAQPMARRVVVDLARCNVCHDVLALHGGQRFNTQECAICHNPNGNDSTYRPADQSPPESISFQRMVHRIHSGENLSQDYTIYGYHGSVNTFNDVRFPGDRRDCVKCHASGTYTVPLPDTDIPTITERDYFSPMQPTAAACLGCHDTKPAAVHAYTMTSALGEACEVCHASDADFAVDKVHAR